MALSAPRKRPNKNASARQMIIQCPQCNTKFALDASLVDQLDEPRFHCSRCDHVFNFDETSPSIKPMAIESAAGARSNLEQSKASRVAPHSQGELPLPRTTASLSTADSRSEPSASSSLAPSRSMAIPSPIPSHRTIQPPHEQAPHQQALDDYFDNDPDEPETTLSDAEFSNEEQELDEYRSEQEAESSIDSPEDYASTFEAEDAEDESLRADTTLEIPEESITPLIPSHLKPAQSAPTSKRPLMPEEQQTFANSRNYSQATDTPPHLEQDSISIHRTSSSPRGVADSVTARSEAAHEAEVPEPIHSSNLDFLDPTAIPAPSRTSRASDLSHAARESSANIEDPYHSLASQYEPLRRSHSGSSWRGLMLMGLPMAATLIVLAVLGFTLRANPELATEISRKAFPAAPQVAPNELFIKNTKFRKVLLDSGESVYVVSGKVLNDSSTTFREVIVEGILFDANGTPLLRTKASASSALAKGRIRSMTPEIIARTQSAATPQDYRMASGDSQEFTLVMDQENAAQAMSKASYFSARIYSVKY